jgi:hypothetical protein
MASISKPKHTVTVVDDQFIFDATPSLADTFICAPAHSSRPEPNRFFSCGRSSIPALKLISRSVKDTGVFKIKIGAEAHSIFNTTHGMPGRSIA